MKIIKYGDKIKPKKKFHASTEYFLLCPICNTANIVQKAVE